MRKVSEKIWKVMVKYFIIDAIAVALYIYFVHCNG